MNFLCKAKRTDNGEWIEGELYTNGKWLNVFNKDAIYIGNADLLREVDPSTVCRYTGSIDKHGKRIFEMDILSARLDDDHPEDITYVQVTWNGFSWCTRESIMDDVMTEWDCEHFEIIGNVFDNPELLEEEHEECEE